MSDTFLREFLAFAAYCKSQHETYADQIKKRVQERIDLDLSLIYSDTQRFMGRLPFPYDLEQFHFIAPNLRTQLKKPYEQTFFFEMCGGSDFSPNTANTVVIEWSALELYDIKTAYPRENAICAEIDLAMAHLSKAIELYNQEVADIFAEQVLQALQRKHLGQPQLGGNGKDPSYIRPPGMLRPAC